MRSRIFTTHWRTILFAAITIAVFTGAAVWLGAGRAVTEAPGRGGLLDELDRSGTLLRTFAPRLAGRVRYRECAPRPSAAADAIPRVTCGGGRMEPLPDEVLGISVRASAEVREGASVPAMHATALIDLVWADTVGNPLERSISYLQQVIRLSDHPADALADLAAAHLIRAGRTQSVRDLVDAVEAAERALEVQPRNPAALFNRALALEWLAVDGEAGRAWRAYLAVDSTSGWANEARGHLRSRTPAASPAVPADTLNPSAFASRAPQEARVRGWTVALGEWGSATLRGDAARAAGSLREADLLGGELERRGGDATLADAVRAIKTAASDPAATRRLAAAHRAFAEAQNATGKAEPAALQVAWERVVAVDPPSDALLNWARRGRAVAMSSGGDKKGGEKALLALAASVDTVRHPALAGSVYAPLAATRLRLGWYQGALEAAERAARHMERAREDEGVANALYVKADAEYALGLYSAAYLTVRRTLLRLRPNPTSLWRGNVLASGARVAMADGLVRAALRLQDERVALFERADRPIHLAEARIARAQMRGAAGYERGAAEDIRAGEGLVRRIRSNDAVEWMMADLRLARADAALHRDPRRAAAMLDTAVEADEGPRPAMRRLRALVARADTRLSLGDARGATADLDRVTRLLDEQRADLASAPLRASLLDAARGVFDRMVMLKLAQGDTAGALVQLEKGRASLLPTAGHATPESPPRMGPGRVALSYALIGDTLLAWTVAGADARLTRTVVRGDTLIRRIERVHSALEVRAREEAVLPDLEALYDGLVRPVAPRLGKPGTEVVIVADGELAGIPFAALRDSARKRYLVEDHPTRFAATLRDASRTSSGQRGEGRGLLVADPAFDARAHPGLERLPAARTEVAAVASAYLGSTVLAGEGATPTAFARALHGARIVHIAGHAAFDDVHPERSSLVLAPEAGVPGSGTLTAAALAEMELRGVSLVVLSACQTLRPGSGRSGGFAGFAGALIGAGAGGVLGSLWRVDDAQTGALMRAFHPRYRELGHGPRALQAAQLQMLRSADPAQRAPSAWAGFRYVGR